MVLSYTLLSKTACHMNDMEPVDSTNDLARTVRDEASRLLGELEENTQIQQKAISKLANVAKHESPEARKISHAGIVAGSLTILGIIVFARASMMTQTTNEKPRTLPVEASKSMDAQQKNIPKHIKTSRRCCFEA